MASADDAIMKLTQRNLSVVTALLVLARLDLVPPVWAAQQLELRVVSSRPDTVTGGEVLVSLSPPATPNWVVRLDGRDVTASFHEGNASGSYLALLSGLKRGANALEVVVGGSVRATLEILDHPVAGPVFSGPHQVPFVCQTVANGLGEPLDEDCSAATQTQYYYKPTEPAREGALGRLIKSMRVFDGASPVVLAAGFKSYDPDHPPADVTSTTTTDGRTVPYIVRRETGVINRAVYDIRFLHEPGRPLPTPWSNRSSGWNGRLLYLFGGGCGAGYHQGNLLGQASDEALIARGYAVAVSTFNIFMNDCNDVLSAETVSMVKEHFIKNFGVPVHTIGWGDSGGAMQLHLIAQNYPGLIDGIIPYISFPDVVGYVASTSDCSLLLSAFGKARNAWTDEQKTAVTGFATWRTCAAGGNRFAIDPRDCNPVLSQADVYDPVDRPKGIRCDIYDNEITVFGRDPQTGYASRPLDNVGVQYGLAAFNAGKIGAEQFVELNEQVGGFDADGNMIPTRTTADVAVIERAYRHGAVLTGGSGLSTTPIIDWRRYADDLGDQHDSFRSFATRARLIAANGGAGNQVIVIDSRGAPFLMALERATDPSPESSLVARREIEFVTAMDRWLDNIGADSESGTLAEKVARDKPSDLADTCWATDGEKISGAGVFGANGRCSQLYPQHADPRIVAGEPRTDDVLKCALKPVSLTDYVHPLTTQELQRLKAVFPTGVCDYSRPGIGQKIVPATWQNFVIGK